MDDTNTIHGPMEFQKVVDAYTTGGRNSIEVTSPYFRPGTVLPIVKLNFVFQGAGLGDYTAYLPALIWNMKNCPWLKCRLFVAPEFMEFAKNILWPWADKMQVCSILKINEITGPGEIIRGPGLTMNGTKFAQLANGTGGHLVTLGFMYFCNLFPPPEGANKYPVINFEGHDPHLPDSLHPRTYVVITTGGVSENRTVPGAYWNPIVEHVKSKGLTPVFIGKSEIVKGLPVKFPDGCDYSAGLDLRDKTTLMQAAWLMKNAACTVGLDNGMIHLAACTDAVIVAGYNMVHPRERRPNRVAGKWAEVTLTREELACTHCQTNMKSMFPHTFNRCLYGDVKCLDLLFADGARKWIDAIELVLR